MAIDPTTMYGIGAGVNALGSVFGGGGDPALGNLHLVNSAQQALYNQMADRLMGGSGDFGYGAAVKQGKSQLQDLMASRGVSVDPNSGAFAGAMGNMIGQAAGMDQDARRQYALGLLGTPLQIAQSAGANFIPGSVSGGPTTQVQTNEYSKFRQGGYVPHGIGQSGGGYRYNG